MSQDDDMSQDDAVRQAGEEILALLPDLVDSASAESMRADLVSALKLSVEDGSIQIGEVLRRNPSTREWVRKRLLQEASDADQAVRISHRLPGFQGLAGLSPTQAGESFICPVCRSPWIRPGIEDDVPPCEIHQVPRIRG